ncbi:MAG: phosphatidylglycerol lysyltransferase domain-containing protein, partial [Candidatus Melainabacteria bacterium]|nr:phosphatidylglycerol lysyltransferase domain-containing protein [Candidatus Melainabacteria bacterium]
IEADSIIVLGDPIGPKEELEELIHNFAEFCSQHDWQLSFFQTTEYNLEIFERLGFRKLKIGDDAIVNLETFDLVGPKKKDFRNRIRKLEKLGYSINYYDAPLPDRVLVRLKQISHDWLMEPGHRERGFSLGYYQDSYIQSHPVMTVENEEGLIVAFLNIIPSYKEGEMGLDLMRKSKEAPSGVMDYLFVQYILKMQELGYKSVNIGMAPMAGFHEHERASFEEKAIHNLFQRLNFLFNYIGLKVFKSKFADSWEPRYLIYKDAPSLPKLAMTINTVLNKV